MSERDDTLPFSMWVWLRWRQARAWFRCCPECGKRGYGTDAPRWDQDPVARMLGLPLAGRCLCCGKPTTPAPHDSDREEGK